MNFFVQIPTRVALESESTVTQCDPTPCTIGGQSNSCGAYKLLVYSVADQAGVRLQSQLTVKEIVTNWSDGAPVIQLDQPTDETARFSDLIGVGANPCPPNGFSFDRRQQFIADLKGKTFQLTTTKRLQLQKNLGGYSITVTNVQQ